MEITLLSMSLTGYPFKLHKTLKKFSFSMLDNLLHKHPFIFCLFSSLLFAAFMYLGSIFSMSFQARNTIALSMAGAVLGLVLGLEILIIRTQRKLKALQLCMGILGGGITAVMIQASITAAMVGAGIGLLLALTANKRLYSTK